MLFCQISLIFAGTVFREEVSGTISSYGLTAILYLLKFVAGGGCRGCRYGLTAILYLLKSEARRIKAKNGYGLTAILYLLK